MKLNELSIDLSLTSKLTKALKKSLDKMEKLTTQRIADDNTAGFVRGVEVCIEIIKKDIQKIHNDKT